MMLLTFGSFLVCYILEKFFISLSVTDSASFCDIKNAINSGWQAPYSSNIFFIKIRGGKEYY